MKVMNMNLVILSSKAEFVGISNDGAPLYASPCKPHGEPVVVMVSAVDFARIGSGGGKFYGGGSAKFSAPNN